MYHGEIMESGTLDDIFRRAEHPYLAALLAGGAAFRHAAGRAPAADPRDPAGRRAASDGADAPWPAEATAPLLECKDIRKAFRLRSGGMFRAGGGLEVVAIDGVSLDIARGECLGLVGESGCGKTTLSKVLLRALMPDSGTVAFNDRGAATDVLALDGEALKGFRRQVQFIFQDPFGSLNPRMSVQDIIAEPLIIHRIGDARSRDEVVAELVTLVGLHVRDLRRYPHSFSGGQRQRIGIARAPGAAAGTGDLRRAGVGARRFDPGADPEPADRPAEKARPDLPVHFAQSGGRRLYRRPDRGHVRRAHRRTGAPRRAVPRSGASLYPGTASGDPIARPGTSSGFSPADAGACLRPDGLAGAVSTGTRNCRQDGRRGPDHWVEATAMPRAAYIREATLAGEG